PPLPAGRRSASPVRGGRLPPRRAGRKDNGSQGRPDRRAGPRAVFAHRVLQAIGTRSSRRGFRLALGPRPLPLARRVHLPARVSLLRTTREKGLRRAGHIWVGTFDAMASPCEVLMKLDDRREAERLLSVVGTDT